VVVVLVDLIMVVVEEAVVSLPQHHNHFLHPHIQL